MLTVEAVSPEDAPEVLVLYGEELKKALESGQGDATNGREMLDMINAGTAQVWAAHDGGNVKGVCVVSVNQYVTGRKVYVHFLAGKGMDDWADVMEAALIECREQADAMCVEGSCRPGLAKRLKRRGWKMKAVIMEAPDV